MSIEFSRQFSQGDPGDKKALIKQLRKNFSKSDIKWLKEDSIHVERTKVSLQDVDDHDRQEWRATHEPGVVKDRRKEIEKGKKLPLVAIDRPGRDNLMLADGHHHFEAAVQLDKSKYPAYVVKVNRGTGPWNNMAEEQKDPRR
jgi:ParB-like chromosome segregation protein Spo0J